MKILIDTHILIWSLAFPSKLGDRNLSLLQDYSNRIIVSSVSIAEISIKTSIGKLKLPENYLEFIDQLEFERLDLRFEHAALLRQLDLLHKDPFDRLLIAQAVIEKAHIMTNDKISELLTLIKL